MKKLLVHESNSFGLVDPETDKGEEIIEIGKFSIENINKTIELCHTLESLNKNFDKTSIRVGFLRFENGNLLAIQPPHYKGSAWVVLAPIVTEEDFKEDR